MLNINELQELLREAARYQETRKEQWILNGKTGERPSLFHSMADYLLEHRITLFEEGVWESIGQRGFVCSNCGSRCLLNYESDWHESKFCPHCGAHMKKEEISNG